MQAYVEQIAANMQWITIETPSPFFNKSQQLIDKGLTLNATAARRSEAQAELCLCCGSRYGMLKGPDLEAQLQTRNSIG